VLSVGEYSIFIRPDLLQQFWQVMSEGGFITDAVEVIDTSGTAPGLVDFLPAELRFRWKDQDHAESVPPGVSS
jgi:hypothetical protein